MPTPRQYDRVLVLQKAKFRNIVHAKAEYVIVDSCCAQVLWMKYQLKDYGISLDHILIKCDNTSAINLTKNPIQHSRIKHIEIRYYFIQDHVQKSDIELEFLTQKNNLRIFLQNP